MGLILASGSPARRQLLANAGLDFSVEPADLDERAAEEPLRRAGADAAEVAAVLAAAKAVRVSEDSPGDLVIGADQTLDLDGERFSKPADAEAARRQLLLLSGKAHQLHSAVACARDGKLLWQHGDSATLYMRPLSPARIGRYVAAAGPAVFGSVGAYQLEGRGIQLFDHIEGDFFTILGLPLLPLLAFLRQMDVIE